MTTANICRYCKDDSGVGYNVQEVFIGNRDNVYVVYCPFCKDEIIPVVVDAFMPRDERYVKFMEAWNNANPEPGKDKE